MREEVARHFPTDRYCSDEHRASPPPFSASVQARASDFGGTLPSSMDLRDTPSAGAFSQLTGFRKKASKPLRAPTVRHPLAVLPALACIHCACRRCMETDQRDLFGQAFAFQTSCREMDDSRIPRITYVPPGSLVLIPCLEFSFIVHTFLHHVLVDSTPCSHLFHRITFLVW